jgi:hypothetical protein
MIPDNATGPSKAAIQPRIPTSSLLLARRADAIDLLIHADASVTSAVA